MLIVKDPAVTTKIRALKEFIKQSADIQHKMKLARKTSMPIVEWNKLKQELAPNKSWWDHSSAAADAYILGHKITAALNLYHELRGSDFRHNVQNRHRYWYDKSMAELNNIS